MFQRYVEKGWSWLAIRVRSEAADKPTLAPHPIKYRYEDTALVYPLVISSFSADSENELVLYTIGRFRYRCKNWANATVNPDDLQLDSEAKSGTNYERLIRSMTDQSQEHIFITEYADYCEDPVLPTSFATTDRTYFRSRRRDTQAQGPAAAVLIFAFWWLGFQLVRRTPRLT